MCTNHVSRLGLLAARALGVRVRETSSPRARLRRALSGHDNDLAAFSRHTSGSVSRHDSRLAISWCGALCVR